MSVFLLAPTAALVFFARPQGADGRGLGMLARPGTTYAVDAASKFAFRLDEAQYTLRFSSPMRWFSSISRCFSSSVRRCILKIRARTAIYDVPATSAMQSA